jgi:hypothetical protein
MYEELVKRLRDISNSDSNIKSNYIGLTMIQATDAIEELSKPKWIPVTDRLPNERGGRLLVCLKLSTGELWQSICRYANNLHDVDKYDFPNENRQGFYCYDNEWGEYTEIENVTHWMPLPPPPKEEI